jgi:hypothetical protein
VRQHVGRPGSGIDQARSRDEADTGTPSLTRELRRPQPRRPDARAFDGIVRKVADAVIADGRFDECGITLAEVAHVREAIVATLLLVHHRRIEYAGFNPPSTPQELEMVVPIP